MDLSKISREQQKEILRWIKSHNDLECKMSAITYDYDGEKRQYIAICQCGEILDITNYG